ncbi:response regulator transcription factor [Methylocystis sp. IM3]|jgi:two-component system OmpR family response regulator|uniref:response regulator transcription factor n=1 Tax=unclassified Methylocystis TaxID=2625913 RepID=UPI0030F9332C
MIAAAKKIIVVEDDDDLRETIVYALASDARSVTGASSAKEFRELAAKEHFDLAIVDINLPDDSGFAIVRSLRETTATKIIVLTGRDTITDRVEGYTHGADIYMVKPTSQAELLAAVESLLRREKPKSAERGWRIDDDDGSLRAPGGHKVTLGLRQTAFMKRLMRSPEKAVNRNELRKVVGIDDDSSRALDMFVARLRRDIEQQAKCKAPIETVPRQGFAFRR